MCLSISIKKNRKKVYDIISCEFIECHIRLKVTNRMYDKMSLCKKQKLNAFSKILFAFFMILFIVIIYMFDFAHFFEF